MALWPLKEGTIERDHQTNQNTKEYIRWFALVARKNPVRSPSTKRQNAFLP
jgi:hypothetical protein